MKDWIDKLDEFLSFSFYYKKERKARTALLSCKKLKMIHSNETGFT